MAPLSRVWTVVHWVIIGNFALQIAYGAYMVFFVIAPQGTVGPLAEGAPGVPFELMTTRRLYASETWLAIVGLSVYLGATEILPRRLRGDGDATRSAASPPGAPR